MWSAKKLTFVACVFEQLVQLAQVATAESVVIAHENLESIARGCEAQSCGEHC